MATKKTQQNQKYLGNTFEAYRRKPPPPLFRFRNGKLVESIEYKIHKEKKLQGFTKNMIIDLIGSICVANICYITCFLINNRQWFKNKKPHISRVFRL